MEASSAVYAPYEVDCVESEKPIKKPHQIVSVLASQIPWADASPLFFLGTSDGTLHSYVPPARSSRENRRAQQLYLRWHMAYKKVFHPCAQFLDSWGVYMTLMDTKLTLYSLPLHANPELDGNATSSLMQDTNLRERMVAVEETKQSTLFAVHEEAAVVATMSKQNVLKVFDWTVHRVLELRTQVDLGGLIAAMSAINTLALPIQKMIWMSESHILLVGKKGWQVLHVDSGKFVPWEESSAQEMGALEPVACAVAVPGDLHHRRERHHCDVFIATKHSAAILSIDTLIHEVSIRPQSSIDFNVAPVSASCHFPFLVLNLPEKLCVYNLFSMKLVQAIPFQSIHGVGVITQLARTLHKSEDQYTKNRIPPALLVVSAPFELSMIKMKSIAKQVEECLKFDRLEDAVMLCTSCPEESHLNEQELRELFARFARSLFIRGEFALSMNYFTRSEVPVQEVLLFFPEDLLPRSSLVTAAKHSQTIDFGSRLVDALVALIDFLWQKKEKLELQFPAASQSDLVLTDTVLLKCLVLVVQDSKFKDKAMDKLQSLVKSPNACDIGESELFLRAHSQFDVLLSFYSAKDLHRKSLELLEDLDRNFQPEQSPASPEGGSKLQKPTHLEELVNYLKKLDAQYTSLVFEFSREVLATKPQLGLSIFVDREVEPHLDIDPSLILNHLKSCEFSGTLDENSKEWKVESEIGSLPLVNNRFVAIEYLHQVILSRRVVLSSHLYDELVYLLLDAINGEVHKPTASATRMTQRVATQQGLVGLLRRKLLQFFELPEADFHPERMLSRTPPEMLDERAALLSRLGRHHDVLQLYALELKDNTLAENYCNKCFEAQQVDSSIYTTLLRLYLRPAIPGISGASASAAAAGSLATSPPKLWRRGSAISGGTTNSVSSEALAVAVNMLNKYAERVEVAAALELLPPSVPVASLSTFFRRVLENQVERHRNGQVKKHLAKIENFKVRELLCSKRKGSVTVWASQCCHICGKKLGVATFVRLPSGALLHYGCQPA